MSEAQGTEIIQGHLTYDAEQKRYLIDGQAAFAQLATLLRLGLPYQETGAGLDFGQVRISVEIIDDEENEA